MSEEALHISPPASPINGQISLPGSKSYTNRFLVLASLATGKTVLHHVSLSDDSIALIDALRLLGVRIEIDKSRLTIDGLGGKFGPYRGEIDVGAAGTTIRFLTALCAAIPGCEVVLTGNKRMQERPIGHLVDALITLGAKIEYLGPNGCPPMRILGQELAGHSVSINGTVSSQFFTALLMVAPLLPQGLRIMVEGAQVSKSYLDMTFAAMKMFGLELQNRDYQEYIVPPRQKYLPKVITVEGDASGASYFWGIAALSQGSITVLNLPPSSVQGDIGFPNLLANMGCVVEKVQAEENLAIRVIGKSPLCGITADMSSMPDTAQTLAVIAACAQGETHMTGLQTLRRKETDRLSALRSELGRIGIQSTVGEGSLTVLGGVRRLARIKTYADHRMAMAFSLLGSIHPGIEIEDPDVVSKSLPQYWTELASLGFTLKRTTEH